MPNDHSLASPCGKSGNGPEVALISLVAVTDFDGAGMGFVSDSMGTFSSECAMMGTVIAGLLASAELVTEAGATGSAAAAGVDAGETDNGETSSWLAS